jgi:MFS superfamily sulfate permease-like transporter
MMIAARGWLRTYDAAWLRADVMAGVTLAAYLLPSAIGDASLAGLPPQAGLYACLFGGLVFWIFCSTTAIGRMFGAKYGYRLDATQEFLAIGSANLMASLGHAFPISGGMSQSLVNETAGARTPASGFVAAVIVLLVALVFTGLLRALPQPVLAAIILVAVTGLVQTKTLRAAVGDRQPVHGAAAPHRLFHGERPARGPGRRRVPARAEGELPPFGRGVPPRRGARAGTRSSSPFDGARG